MDFSSPFQHTPPPGPRPPSRRSTVLSQRWRRVLAAAGVSLLIGVAYLGLRDVLTASWIPAYRFTSSLAAGTVITSEQVEAIRLPASVAPTDPVADADTLVGKPLARPVSAGDFATSRHVVAGGRGWTPTPTSRLMSIPSPADVPDATVGALVDVVSAAEATVLGTGIVVGFHTPVGGGGLLSSPSTQSRVIVAVEAPMVGKVARALASTGGVSLAVHPTTPPR